MAKFSWLPSQQHNTLQAGYLDAFSAPRIAATEDVVDTHHIITRSFESHVILFVCVPGERWFFRAANPADLILAGLLTRGAVYGMRLRLCLLVEKISLLHRYSPFAGVFQR